MKKAWQRRAAPPLQRNGVALTGTLPRRRGDNTSPFVPRIHFSRAGDPHGTHRRHVGSVTVCRSPEEATVADAQQSASEASSAAAAEADAGEAFTDNVAAGADTAIKTAEQAAEEADEGIDLIPVAEEGGAILTASSVGIVLVCVTALIEGSIDLATRVALPDKLSGALSDAQKPVDLAGKDNATAQLIYAQMTEPDRTTTDPGLALNVATDLHINPDVYADGSYSPQTIRYVALDGTSRVARAPHDGWWVDCDANESNCRLTLRIEFRDPSNTAWTATRVGPGVLLGKNVDGNATNEVATTTFDYVDWNPSNWTPSDHSQFAARRARVVSDSTEAWSISATAPTTINSIAHFNPATGQQDWATAINGGAIKVAVGPNGQPWVVNQQGALYNRTKGTSGTYDDGQWHAVPGQVSDVAVGADGSVWAIGGINDVANIGGSHIYHYNPIPASQATNGWEVVDGGAIAVAVGPDGQPWIVNKQGTIFNRTKGSGIAVVKNFNGQTLVAGPSGTYVDGQWQVVPGNLSDIAVGVDGSVWGIGASNDVANIGGSHIYHYNPIPASQATNGWEVVDGGAIAIGVGQWPALGGEQAGRRVQSLTRSDELCGRCPEGGRAKRLRPQASTPAVLSSKGQATTVTGGERRVTLAGASPLRERRRASSLRSGAAGCM
jgi:hypothetical protein